MGAPVGCYPLRRRACQAAALRSGAPAGSKESRGGARPRRVRAKVRSGTDGTRAPESGRSGCAVTRARPVRGGRTATARAHGPARAGDAHEPIRSSPAGPLASSEGRAPDGSGDRGSGVHTVRTGTTSINRAGSNHARDDLGDVRDPGGRSCGGAAQARRAEVRHPGARGDQACCASADPTPARPGVR